MNRLIYKTTSCKGFLWKCWLKSGRKTFLLLLVSSKVFYYTSRKGNLQLSISYNNGLLSDRSLYKWSDCLIFRPIIGKCQRNEYEEIYFVFSEISLTSLFVEIYVKICYSSSLCMFHNRAPNQFVLIIHIVVEAYFDVSVESCLISDRAKSSYSF